VNKPKAKIGKKRPCSRDKDQKQEWKKWSEDEEREKERDK